MSDKKNCALSFKKDNSGSCNTIVNGKLRVKKTARIEDTLAVENNLQVYNDVNIGGDINAKNLNVECIETKGLTADTIGATSITTSSLVATECVETKGLTADTIGATSITVECLETKGITADSINVENITVNNTVFFNSMTGNSINVDTIVANEITGYTFTAVVCVTSINISVTGTIEADGIIVNTVETKSLTADTISTTSIYANTACIDELEMGVINPKGLTVGDNYIRMNAGGISQANKWIRYRSTTDPYHSGVVFSEFDTHNYFMYANESTSSVSGVSGTTSCENANLFISYYGTTVNGNDPIYELSTPIFSLCPNGDLKLAGIVEAKGLTADTIGATTINTVDLNVSGTAIFGGGSIKIDGDNHTISTTIDEDLKFETGGTSSNIVMNFDGNNTDLIIKSDNNSYRNGIAFQRGNGNYSCRIFRNAGIDNADLIFSVGNTADPINLSEAMRIDNETQKVTIQNDLEVTNDLKVLNDLTVTGTLNAGSIGFTGISLTSITATDGCIDNLEIDTLAPKNSTSVDNYVVMRSFNPPDNISNWMRYRSSVTPYSSGTVFSRFNSYHYFMYAANTDTTGITGGQTCDDANLSINFLNSSGTGLIGDDFKYSTRILNLCPNGDLSINGILDSKGLTADTINGFSTNDLQQNKLGSKFDKDKTGSEVTILKNGLGVFYSSTTKSRAMCLNSFTIPFGTDLNFSFEGFKRKFGFKIVYYDDTADLNIGFGISTLIKNGISVSDTEIGSFSYRYDGELFENGSNTTSGLPSYTKGDIIEFEISSTTIIPYKDFYKIYKNGVLIHTSFIINNGLYYPQVFDSSSTNSTFKIVLMPSYNTGYLETLKLTTNDITANDITTNSITTDNLIINDKSLCHGYFIYQQGDTLLQMNIPTFVGGLSGTTHINLTNNGYSGPDYSDYTTSDFKTYSSSSGFQYTGTETKTFKIKYIITGTRQNTPGDTDKKNSIFNIQFLKTSDEISYEILNESNCGVRITDGSSQTFTGESYVVLSQNDYIGPWIYSVDKSGLFNIYSYSFVAEQR